MIQRIKIPGTKKNKFFATTRGNGRIIHDPNGRHSCLNNSTITGFHPKTGKAFLKCNICKKELLEP